MVYKGSAWASPLLLLMIMLACGGEEASVSTPTSPSPVPSPEATGTTYYVRPDGGSATECNGRVDAPRSADSRDCAWDHPFRGLPPGGPPNIGGGDTLLIREGEYMMGVGAPGADACDRDSPWDCRMPPIPSGPSSTNPTRILGAGWSGGCPDKPELWGTERADPIIDLTGSANVEIACLEITDHSGCVEDHTGGLECNRAVPPFGDWSARGIYAQDAAAIHLKDLDVHGLASTGIHAGRLTDWTVENVRIAANGLAGWDGDLWEGDSSNSGTLAFRNLKIEWNGCGETWPANQPSGCWAQTAGGYGDGLGTAATQGEWIFEDSAFLYNTSDGLDLLYAQPGSSIEIRRTIAMGNAGNQIKTNGPTLIENSIIVGNCGYFESQPFTFHVDNCRAAGNALSLNLRRGDRVTVTNNTLASEGDCLVLAECEGICDGTESVRMRNNIFQGYADFLEPEERTCLMYQETFPVSPFDSDFSLIHHVKHDPCPGPNDRCGIPPGLTRSVPDAFDAHLLPDSPAIDAGTADGAPVDDFDGRERDERPDIGAYEWRGSEPTAVLSGKR